MGGGLGMTTRGTACSTSYVKNLSRGAARWRATWINNFILSRTTGKGLPLLWKLHLQVKRTVIALKSQYFPICSVIGHVRFFLIYFLFILAAINKHTPRERRGRDRLSQIKRYDRPACLAAELKLLGLKTQKQGCKRLTSLG